MITGKYTPFRAAFKLPTVSHTDVGDVGCPGNSLRTVAEATFQLLPTREKSRHSLHIFHLQQENTELRSNAYAIKRNEAALEIRYCVDISIVNPPGFASPNPPSML